MFNLPEDVVSRIVADALGPTDIASLARVCRLLAKLFRHNTKALQVSFARLGLGLALPQAKMRFSRLAQWQFRLPEMCMGRVMGVYPWRLAGAPCFVMVDTDSHAVCAWLLAPLRCVRLRGYEWIQDACQLGNGDVLIACMNGGVWSLRANVIVGPPARRIISAGNDTYVADAFHGHLYVFRVKYTPGTGGYDTVFVVPSFVHPSITTVLLRRRVVVCPNVMFYVHDTGNCISPLSLSDTTQPCTWTRVFCRSRIVALVGPFFDDCCAVVTRNSCNEWKIELFSPNGTRHDCHPLPFVNSEHHLCVLGSRWLLHDSPDRRWILHYDDNRQSHLQLFEGRLHEETVAVGYADPDHALVCTREGAARVLW